MKYNYVIFGSENDYYLYMYRDIMSMENVRYICSPIDSHNKLLTNLYRFHTSPKTNEIIKLPFKSIWNYLHFNNTFINSKPICFVFFSRKGRLLNNGIIAYLKRKYPNSKFVIFFQDIVEKCNDVSIKWIKENFDLLLSFDRSDCNKYGLVYHQNVYSIIKESDNDNIMESDVYFLGLAKERYKKIIEVFEMLSSNGIKCDFYISGVPTDKRIYSDKINYIERMSYSDNLRHINRTKCLLEIMQNRANGYTLRTCEAIAYGKYLLTNNPEIQNAPFYNEKAICYFSDSKSIDTDGIKSFVPPFDYNYADELSPRELLAFIEERL